MPRIVLSWRPIEKYHNPVQVSPATPSRVTTAGPSDSAPRTGLASLPPLNPEVSSHRMTVTTVPARVTDEVFRLYVKYQVSSDMPTDPVHRCQAPWHVNSAGCAGVDSSAGAVDAGCRVYDSESLLDGLGSRGRVDMGRSDRAIAHFFHISQHCLISHPTYVRHVLLVCLASHALILGEVFDSA